MAPPRRKGAAKAQSLAQPPPHAVALDRVAGLAGHGQSDAWRAALVANPRLQAEGPRMETRALGRPDEICTLLESLGADGAGVVACRALEPGTGHGPIALSAFEARALRRRGACGGGRAAQR